MTADGTIIMQLGDLKSLARDRGYTEAFDWIVSHQEGEAAAQLAEALRKGEADQSALTQTEITALDGHGFDVNGTPLSSYTNRRQQEIRQMAAMYHRVLRKPKEGTATDAIKMHAQACGLVAYVMDVSIDRVAGAVREAEVWGEWEL